MQTPHDLMFPPSSGDATREAFWGELQTFLEAEVRPGFRAHYETAVAPRLKARIGHEPDRYEIAAEMLEVDANRAWYIARTEAQRKAFEASRAIVETQVPALEARAARYGNGPAKLELAKERIFPDYVPEEVHNMAGGYEDRDGHPLIAGAIYDRALSVHRVAAQGPLVNDVGNSIAQYIREHYPVFRPRSILEMGCTIGHSTLPFKQAYPDAEVIGIDVGAPGLRYGAARASALGVDVTFSERNAEATGYPDESFDLIFSRILLHETCESATHNIFAECFRLLRPGGMMFHSDAPQFDELDAYSQSLRDWDARFNAEPFMDGYYAMNLEEEFSKAGFDKARTFRHYAPSLIVKQGYRAQDTRSSKGRYFFAGAFK